METTNATDPGPVGVSYLISSYNHAPFLRRSIESVLAQTYENVELLVCDDCSTDGSRELLEAYAAEKGFTLLVNEANRGAAHGLNRMIEQASGTYIGLLASDDWLEPAKTAAQVSFLVDRGKDAVLAPVKYFDETTGEITAGTLDGLRDVLEPAPYLRRLYRTDAGGLMTQSGLFRRSAVQGIGGFREDYRSDDWLLMIRFLQAGYTVGFMEDAYTVYRLHQANTHKRAVYCLENLQLPVIRDFVPAPYQQDALASVHLTCAMKLVDENPRLSLLYAARSARLKPHWRDLLGYVKSLLLTRPLIRRAYFSMVRPARVRIAEGRRARA